MINHTNNKQECHIIKKEKTDKLLSKIENLVINKQYQEATSTLKSLINEKKYNPKIYSLLGDILQNISKIDAIHYYEEGLSIYPKDPHLNIGLGFLYFNNKDYHNSEKYILNIWVEDPTNIKLLTALGKIYKSRKQFEKAMKYFRICELLDPNNSFALYGLADTYRGLGDNDNALKYWLKFHGIEPANKVALTRIGDCFAKAGNKDKAVLFYNKALDIGYDFFAHIGIAKIYIANDRIDKAIEIYEKLQQSENNNSRYYYEYITCCFQSAQKDKAIQLYNKAIALFPGNAQIQSLVEKFI